MATIENTEQWAAGFAIRLQAIGLRSQASLLNEQAKRLDETADRLFQVGAISDGEANELLDEMGGQLSRSGEATPPAPSDSAFLVTGHEAELISIMHGRTQRGQMNDTDAIAAEVGLDPEEVVKTLQGMMHPRDLVRHVRHGDRDEEWLLTSKAMTALRRS